MNCNIKNRTILCGDSLEISRGIDSNTIDLIYLDPPFNKKKEFIAKEGSLSEGASFSDIFKKEHVKEEWITTISDRYPILHEYIQGIGNIGHISNKYYLYYIGIRVIEFHRVLKETGSLYLHCDPLMSHYLKLLLDCVFGEKNFRNEIVWCYSSPSNTKRFFPRKHDTIFFYSKSSKWTFNHEDIRVPYKTLIEGEGGGFLKGYTISSSTGKLPEDWWNECHDSMTPVGRIPAQRTGYPTQKPLSLLERIIKVSSNEGDIVLDPFCGSGTTCIAAEKLRRQWVGIDISKEAYTLLKDRLGKEISNERDLFDPCKYVTFKDFPT